MGSNPIESTQSLSIREDAMKHRVVAALLVFITLFTVLFASPAPAQASWGDCNPGIGCVWKDALGTGPILKLAYGTFGSACWNFGGTWANNIESARHSYGSGRLLRLYTDPYCSGNRISLLPNVEYTWGPGHTFYNSISSFKIL